MPPYLAYGRTHLWLTLEGDARETTPPPPRPGRSVTLRRPRGGLVLLRVRVTTDAAALTPHGPGNPIPPGPPFLDLDNSRMGGDVT